MNEEIIFQQIEKIRLNTLKEFENLTEEEADKVPEGFRNNIRWNLGHIYMVQNALLAKYGGINIETPRRYLELFSPGTKPADWEGEIPTLDDIKQKLADQPAQLKEILAGKLDHKAVEPFLSLETVGALLNFSLYHEGVHYGTIRSLKKLNAL